MTAGDPQPAAPSHKSRWFCLTPDHNLAALLVVEGLLWLSERIGWPTWPKGYAVLTAVAAAALALLLLLVWFAVALLFRWRFQFSTRSLLVLTVAVAIPCSWLAVERKKAREQQQVVATIEKQLRGSVAYDWEYDVDGAWLPNARPPGPSWLRDLLGEDFFRAVVRVNLSDEKVTDAALEQLKGLGQLRKLWLEHTKVTDAGLERLRGLRQLQELSLRGTEVTGTGLENLKGLGQLHPTSRNFLSPIGA
jgi:hypothetical protein